MNINLFTCLHAIQYIFYHSLIKISSNYAAGAWVLVLMFEKHTLDTVNMHINRLVNEVSVRKIQTRELNHHKA